MTTTQALTAQQKRAVDAIANGATDAAAAEAAGVHRVTVCQWRNHNPTFRAAIASLQSEGRAAAVDTHRRLYAKALAWAEAELDRNGPDAARVALGVISRGPPATAAEAEQPRHVVVTIAARRRDGTETESTRNPDGTTTEKELDATGAVVMVRTRNPDGTVRPGGSVAANSSTTGPA